QGLGRDAAVVQAGSAEFVLFDQGDVHAEFAGSEGRGVTAAAASQDDQIEALTGIAGRAPRIVWTVVDHGTTPRSRRCRRVALHRSAVLLRCPQRPPV